MRIVRDFPWLPTLCPVILAGGFLVPNARSSQAAELDAQFRAETVQRVAQMIEDGYVDSGMGQRLATHLRQALSDGDYDDAHTGEQLAAELTAALRAASQDLHFQVVYRPPAPTAVVTSTAQVEQTPENRQDQRLTELRRENFGFTSLQRLPGNVFYIELERFVDPDLAGKTAVAAMDFVANADAVLIDLRANRGGDPRMIQLIASYFLRSATELTGLYWRSIDKINQSWTLPHVPGERLLDVDLYVLTSGRTFSAAEAFAYDLKVLERATMVGERTAGGANPIGSRQRVNDSFRIDLPIGKAISPVTQSNWEGVGVEPDIETPSEEALARAHGMAVRRLLAEADEERINEVAYEFLHDDLLQGAIELFEWNVDRHPRYANGYDSLGEAYLAADRRDDAVAAYRKALELDPSLHSSAEALARLAGHPGTH